MISSASVLVVALLLTAFDWTPLTHDLISEATRDKLAAKKAAGAKLGAPSKLTASQKSAARKMKAAGMAVSDIAETFTVSQATVYRALAS
jgi:DNA invertase Pin-like site-specific DNA recombinase